jgi:hypothetical protein
MNEALNVISLGAGVQSSTMALMAAHGEIGPMPAAAIFADTQDEPAAVYVWLDWLEKQLPFPVVRVTKGQLSKAITTPFISERGNRTMWTIPMFSQSGGMFMRQCTSNFKVHPIQKEVTRQMRLHKADKCALWIGISLDEIHRTKTSPRANVEHRYPLVDLRLRRPDCLLWMSRHGYPQPPRSACIYCPYRTNQQWQSLTPEEKEKAAVIEEKIQASCREIGLPHVPFLHRSRLPLRDALRDDAEATLRDKDQGEFDWGNECEGMCGV